MTAPHPPVLHRSATPELLRPWVAELARTARGFVGSYVPGRPIDARTRERIMLAVAEANGARGCAWIHRSWRDFLGDPAPADGDDPVLVYARACAEEGRPLPDDQLARALAPEARDAVRATVAQGEIANLVEGTVGDLVARVRGRRSFAPFAMVREVATVAAALPIAAPLVAGAAAMRTVERLAPRPPEVVAPEGEEANLLTHLLARAVPSCLAHALVRTVVLRFPLPVAVGIRNGASAATVRIAGGVVEVENDIADDAQLVVEGDVEPLLRLASGALARDLASIRIKPH